MSKGARIRAARAKDEGEKQRRREALPKLRGPRSLRDRSRYRPGGKSKGGAA